MESQKALELLQGSTEESEIRVALSAIAKKPTLVQEEISAMANCLLSENLAIKDLAAKVLSDLAGMNKELAAKVLSGYIIGDNVELRNLAGEILKHLGIVSAKYLAGYLSSTDPDWRQFACDLMAEIDSKEYLEDISALLTDENENCRISATIAIGNMEAKEYSSVLIGMYSQYEDSKPVIIESLGKIGGIQVEEFLIDRLDEEEDIFIITTLIDALARAGSDAGICNELMEKIDSIPEPIQPYILKTIYAIATRTNTKIDLPTNKRNIAHRSMMDEDEDVRIAGLLALGSAYQVADIEYLINEIHYRLSITQKIILENLVLGTEFSVVDHFFDRFMVKCDDENKFEFIAQLKVIWNESIKKNSSSIINKILEQSFNEECMITSDLVRLLFQLNKEVTSEFYKSKINSQNENRAKEILFQAGLQI
jgi:HEAT repeat protein